MPGTLLNPGGEGSRQGRQSPCTQRAFIPVEKSDSKHMMALERGRKVKLLECKQGRPLEEVTCKLSTSRQRPHEKSTEESRPGREGPAGSVVGTVSAFGCTPPPPVSLASGTQRWHVAGSLYNCWVDGQKGQPA